MAVIPVGGIIWWEDDPSTLPTSYQVCDGTNGTYDLADKFVRGAGSTYVPGQVGGSRYGSVAPHTHRADLLTEADMGLPQGFFWDHALAAHGSYIDTVLYNVVTGDSYDFVSGTGFNYQFQAFTDRFTVPVDSTTFGYPMIDGGHGHIWAFTTNVVETGQDAANSTPGGPYQNPDGSLNWLPVEKDAGEAHSHSAIWDMGSGYWSAPSIASRIVGAFGWTEGGHWHEASGSTGLPIDGYDASYYAIVKPVPSQVEVTPSCVGKYFIQRMS
jgi:hypothetical protein